MTCYKVTLIKEEVYYVQANNSNEAIDEAIRLDTDGGDSFLRKLYYDKMEAEEVR